MTATTKAKTLRRQVAAAHVDYRMLAAVRLSGGITQARLAEHLGVHRVTLANWELGNHLPRGDRLARWRAACEEIVDKLGSG
jgi:transcriptional regulator with XRE-family HTH domain